LIEASIELRSDPGSFGKNDHSGLVRAAQAGDRRAFGELYQQHARLVHGVLLAHVEPADAEDLMQNVFVKALEQIASLREAGAFGGWLLAIARRTAADFHRQRKIGPIGLDAAGGPQPDHEAFAILDALRTLPEAYRETLLLRLVEGMTGPEIAARTGLTPDSVRVNLCRGMRRLREVLKTQV
jgi:RNA polymerase sigma-70 factor (ECF subfamily)